MEERLLSVTYDLGGYDTGAPDGNVVEQVAAVPAGDTWTIEVRDGAGIVLESRPAASWEVASLDVVPAEQTQEQQRITELEAQLARLIEALGGW